MGRWLDLMKRTIKKVLNCLMVLLLALSVFARNATIVSAADSTKGIEITVDRTELDNTIQAAKNAGVPVQKDQDVDNGVAQSKMEVDANIAAIKADYAAQIAAINAEIQKKQDCDQLEAEYQAKLAIYNAELAKYNHDMEEYNQKVLAYNQEMKELEQHLHEDGYLSQPIGQSLIFKSEPNATVSISNGTVYTEAQLDALVRSWGFGPGDWGYAYFEQLNKGLPGTPQHLVSGDLRTVFELGKTTTVTYTNLQNSTMNGKKLQKLYSSILLKIRHAYLVRCL